MSNSQKTPLVRALQKAIAAGSLDEISRLGLALPGHVISISGIMVEIAFDVMTLPPYTPGQPPPQPRASMPPVTIPVAGSEYVRLPIQPGDKGLAVPADVFLGNITGQPGEPVPVLGPNRPGNLSTLCWVPISTLKFAAVNALYLVLSGPSGVQICGAVPPLGGSTPIITITNTGISLAVGSNSIVINASGVTIMGKDFLTHAHQSDPPGTLTANLSTGVVTGITGPVN